MDDLKKLRELTKTLIAKDELLVEQTNSWKYILNAMTDCVFITNPQGEITFINKQLQNRLSDHGYKSVEELPCYIKAMSEHEGHIDELESLGEIDLPYLGGWYDHAIAPIYDEDSVIIGYICILKNINEKKIAEIELRKSEEKFRNISQSAYDAIIIADERGKIVSWNKSAEKMFGYTEEEILNEELIILMPEKYRKRHTSSFNSIIKAHHTSEYVGKIIKLEGLHKDGHVFPIRTWVEKVEQG